MSEAPSTMTGRDRLAVAVLCAAQFMLIVDVVVMNVALPTLRASLGVPDSQLALTAVAYAVTFGSLLIAAGRSGDVLGRRRVFLAGLALFTAASLATGLAQESWQFFAARAGQGIGAALISPSALALLLARFDDTAARNKALGAWGAVGAGGAIAGQVLGGIVVESLGWRWIFFLNLPVGLAAAVVGVAVLQESRSHAGALNVLGSVLLIAGLAPAVLALALLPTHGLSGRVALLGALALTALAVFVAHERRASAPLVSRGLLRTSGVLAGNLVLALSAATVTASLFFTTLYLQVVLGHSALLVGLAFAPITVLIMVLAPATATWVTRYGARPPLVAGLLLGATGMLLLSRMEAGGSYWTHVLPALLVIAVGSALSYVPTFIAATARVDQASQGAASGLVNTSQELGPALGLAIIAGVASTVTGTSGAVRDLVAGYSAGLWVAATLAAAAALAAFRLPGGLGRGTAETAEEELIPVH